MEPSFKMNQKVLVSSLPYFFKSPKKEEVVVFKDYKSEKLILKRIKKVLGKKYLVVGDNQKDTSDFGFIERSQIVGCVIYKV